MALLNNLQINKKNDIYSEPNHYTSAFSLSRLKTHYLLRIHFIFCQIYFVILVNIIFILQVFPCKVYFVISVIATFTFWSPYQLLFVNITQKFGHT